MLNKKLKKYNIILGSSSPRRKQLLRGLNILFSIKKTNKKEEYPLDFKKTNIAEFLAKQKAKFISEKITNNNYLLITADTIVIQNKEILHKPKDKNDAIKTLKQLSGKKHEVITGVCITTNQKEVVFSSVTEVYFNDLSQYEIIHYIDHFKPFDKAGSYGIQEWIGYIGIKNIKGCYNNVMGLPTSKLYEKLHIFT